MYSHVQATRSCIPLQGVHAPQVPNKSLLWAPRKGKSCGFSVVLFCFPPPNSVQDNGWSHVGTNHIIKIKIWESCYIISCVPFSDYADRKMIRSSIGRHLTFWNTLFYLICTDSQWLIFKYNPKPTWNLDKVVASKIILLHTHLRREIKCIHLFSK